MDSEQPLEPNDARSPETEVSVPDSYYGRADTPAERPE
jgi:hypothetical protein